MADLASKLAEGVTCSICHEYYRTPKVLGCLHRFCRDCLQHYINSKARDNGIVCPECRQVTRPPLSPSGAAALRRSEWADHFPTDFLVTSMVDNLKSQQKKNEICSAHSGNPVVLFCQDCHKMICHVCAGVDHRKCERVVPLRQEAERKRARLLQLLTHIREKRKILKLNDEKLSRARAELDAGYDKAVSKVKGEFQKIHKLVKDREDLCMMNLRSQHSLENAHIIAANMRQLGLKTEIGETERSLNTVLKTKSDPQIIQERTAKYSVPDVPAEDLKSKRPFASYDELFGGVLKKMKIEETKTFLGSK